MIAGLSIGLTVGIIFTPILIGWGASLGMGGEAWRMPFFVFAAFTFVVVAIAFTFFRAKLGGAMRLGPPFLRLLLFSAPTFLVIVALFLVAETFRLAGVADRVGRLAHRAGLHPDHRAQRQAVGPRPCPAQPQHLAGLPGLHRDPVEPLVLQLLVGADRPEAAQSSLLVAALTAAFNAGAGILGFPRRWLAGRPRGAHRP